MAKRGKRIERMQQHQRGLWPEDRDAALIDAGFSSHQEGSHRTYRLGTVKLTDPQHRPFLKPAYVRAALRLLGEVEEGTSEEPKEEET